MKKPILTLLAVSIAFLSFGQNRSLNLVDFNSWSIQGNLNTNISNTDIAKNDLFYSKTSLNLGYGARLTKYISNNFGLAFDVHNSTLKGSNSKWDYKTNINYQTSVLLIAQTGNVRYFRNLENFQLYGYLGYGMLNYKAEAKNNVNPELNSSSKGNYQVIPIGLGAKYHLKENMTINLEYSFNNVNGDKLDAFSDALTEYDKYSRLSVGFSYTLGKSYKKELEWHDPRPTPAKPYYRVDTVVVVQKTMKPDTNIRKATDVSALLSDSVVMGKLMDSLETNLLTTTIYYDFNKWDFPIIYNQRLTDISLEVLNYEGNKILIQSFCDTVGTPEKNRAIVERRANEIKKRIIGFGISESLIVVVLHGEEDAIEPTDAENRRSIISVIDKKNLYYNGPIK
jgi:outer membrane protein OmpA-like peptidoglycan-associated protein